MSDRMTNIELLLMVAQDLKAQGDDLSHEISEKGKTHYERVISLLGRLDQAKAMLEMERQRFAWTVPRQRQDQALGQAVNDVPRIVRQGPVKSAE